MFKRVPPPFRASLFALALLASACDKTQDISPDNTLRGIDPSKVQWVPTTAEEKSFVANLGKVTNVIKELYKNPKHTNLVKAAIYAKAYTDESILLRDLIYPDNSVLPYNGKFAELCKRKNLTLTDFSKDFWQEVDKANDVTFKQFLNSLKVETVASRGVAGAFIDGVSIYYPYSNVFEDVDLGDNDGGGSQSGPMTVVTATADADQGWGTVPYTNSDGSTRYETVLVDDEYAENHPTQIIGANGVEPYTQGPTTASLVFAPGPPIQVPGLPRSVKEVWISHLQCKKHYDKLISATLNGGGNEMVFTRGDGYLKLSDGRATGDVGAVGERSISRWHITHSKFHDFNTLWDGDWELDNREQNIALYERDNRNEQTFKGTLKTTLSTGIPAAPKADGDIGFEFKFKSDDAIIFNTNLKQDVFFVLNRLDLEGGFYPIQQGWPIRRILSEDSYTLADRTRIP